MLQSSKIYNWICVRYGYVYFLEKLRNICIGQFLKFNAKKKGSKEHLFEVNFNLKEF